jgi:hypothetical protein
MKIFVAIPCQARIAQAQINQQGNIASDNKTAGLIGGAKYGHK